MSFRIEELITPKKGWFTPEERSKCLNKSKYSSSYSARQAAADHQFQTGDRMNSYKCAYCGFFHIGHPKRIH